MKQFEYADEKISDKEIMIAIPSMIVAVGILTLPRDLAENSLSADGWIAILISGILFCFLTWMVAKLAVQFPNETFFTYASRLVPKPVAIVFTLLYVVLGIMFAAYEVRELSDLAGNYLFDQTPVEVIALAFLLVVVYGASGSRAGIFRLNMMFFPIIGFIGVSIVFFSLGWFKVENLLPMFETSLTDHVETLKVSTLSYSGFSILLFYIALVRQPKKVPKMVVAGVSIAVLLYLILFITSVGVFGIATAHLIYPIVELGKVIEVPGGFFERFESIFFVVWIMAIFNTTLMALDIAVYGLQSIFTRIKKVKLLLFLTPLIFVISMFPQNYMEIALLGRFISYYELILTGFVTTLLLIIASRKGGKTGG
ncbi:GerAB/ArcD/ProY family transporter [Oceanobacillus halotolerans]|uniref:GerAB/ArcD/ProY family transporter n=1 Tax=Oceanobacillus halotolerans TaxID=2663380 RepID=UPI0013DA9AE1|nr:endospore germination permease [Oceanobacillus halotolerans]